MVPDGGGQGGPIQGGKPAVSKEPAAAYHDVPHVGGPGRVDQMGVGVVEGGEVGLIHVHHDQVGGLARGQGPGGFAQPQYLRALPGGQGHHPGGGHQRRVAAPDLVEPGRQAHFAPQVQVVVGGGPIRSQPHRHPELEQGRDGRHVVWQILVTQNDERLIAGGGYFNSPAQLLQ